MGSTLILTTLGSKTGKKRDVQLAAFPDADGWLIVGSKGGAATHPSWYLNMARHPDDVWVQRGHRRIQVRPKSLKGEDRAAAWKRIVSDSPQFAKYEVSTDRQIPVVRLTPVDQP